MNRRNFIRGLLATGASFTVLPSAGRLWVAKRPELIINPEWVAAEYEVVLYGYSDDNRLVASYGPSPAERFKIVNGVMVPIPPYA
jgi:hypothetical protein